MRRQSAVRGIQPIDSQKNTSASAEVATKDPGLQLLLLDELFTAEGGKPCVVKGFCRLCAGVAIDARSGNPRCRGCSIADTLSFQDHPFRPLLEDVHAAVRIRRPEARRPNTV